MKINILGVKLTSRLQWGNYVSKLINHARKALNAIRPNQTSANNLTKSHNSKITWYLVFIWGQIPGRIEVNDSTRTIFGILHVVHCLHSILVLFFLKIYFQQFRSCRKTAHMSIVIKLLRIPLCNTGVTAASFQLSGMSPCLIEWLCKLENA